MDDFETRGFPHESGGEMPFISALALEVRGFESDVGDFEDAHGEGVVFIFAQGFK